MDSTPSVKPSISWARKICVVATLSPLKQEMHVIVGVDSPLPQQSNSIKNDGHRPTFMQNGAANRTDPTQARGQDREYVQEDTERNVLADHLQSAAR